MNILFLSTWFPYPPDNGSKIRVYHLLDGLKRSHNVTLVSFAFGSARPDAAVRSSGLAIDTVDMNPFEVNRRAAPARFLAREPVVNRPIAAMRRLVRQKSQERRYEVVIASGGVMSSYALETEGPLFRSLEEHNSFSRLMHERLKRARNPVERLRYWLSWRKTRRYERQLFSQFDLVTMASEEDKSYSARYVHRPDARVEVVQNGVDVEWNQPDLTHPVAGRLVYNGSLTYSANYDAMRYFLADIYPQVRDRVPEVSLTITGSTSGVDLKSLALDPSVNLTGYVEDVRLEVAQAEVVVVPLREGGGSRLKILEAMALGRPVISTSKGAEGLDVTAGEELLIADDPEEFANATIGLLKDRDAQRRLSVAGRRLVESQYDWRPISHSYAQLLEESIRKKKYAIGQAT